MGLRKKVSVRDLPRCEGGMAKKRLKDACQKGKKLSDVAVG